MPVGCAELLDRKRRAARPGARAGCHRDRRRALRDHRRDRAARRDLRRRRIERALHAVPLRRLEEQAVLRRHALADRVPRPAGEITHGEKMTAARHPRPPELAGLSLEEIAQKFVARFRDRKADWAAFEDASIEGYKRAQHRFIGAGGSGKHGDAAVIPPRGFTLSIMYVEPGQGNAAHTHEVEEVFFVLQGALTAFLQDESGRRVDIKLDPWECIACPPTT